jgi:hypothetical protein
VCERLSARFEAGYEFRRMLTAPDMMTVEVGDNLLTRYGSGFVTMSAAPVVAVGADAGDEADAETKGPVIDLSAYDFDALHEDAALAGSRRRDRPRAGPRLCLISLDGRGHGYILASVNSRAALASRRMIGTEV